MKSLMKTISVMMAALLLVFGVLTVGAISASAEDASGEQPVAVGVDAGDVAVGVAADDTETEAAVGVAADDTETEAAVGVEANDVDLDDEVETEASESSEGITYTTPAEAFGELRDKFVNFFKAIGSFFTGIKEKFGEGAMIGAIALAIVVYLFFIFCLALAFKKAGVNPIFAVIPVVSVYYCFKIGWETEKLWILLIGLVVAIFFGTCANVREINGWEIPSIITTLLVVVAIIGWGIVVVFVIHLAQGWAEGFDLHFSFGLGLMILPIVFVPIIALVKSIKYQYALGTGQVKVD